MLQDAIPRTPKQVHRRLRPDQVDQVVCLYLAGATLKELGKQFHVHRTTLSELLEWRGIQRRYGSLTPEQEDQALELYAFGLSLVAVGDITSRSTRAPFGMRSREEVSGSGTAMEANASSR